MKKKFSNEIIAAVFVLVAGTLVIALSLKVSGTLDLLTRETYEVRVRFDLISGVEPSSKVTLNGVKVGRVKDLRLVKDDPQGANVEVVLELDKEKAMVYQDVKATAAASTMLSEKHIALTGGTPGAETLAEGDLIYGTPAPDLNRLLQRAEETVQALQEFISDETIQGNIRSIVVEAKTLVSNLRELSETAQEMLGENRTKIDSVIDNVNASSQNFVKITEDIKQGVSEIQRDLQKLIATANSLLEENRPNVRQSVEQVRQMTETLNARIEPLLEQAHQLAAQLNDTAGENRDEIDQLIQNIESTSANMKSFSKQLSDYPWQLIYPGEKRRETQTLYPAWKPVSATPEGPLPPNGKTE